MPLRRIVVTRSGSLENLRRSIVMTAGATVGPLTKVAAPALIEEVQTRWAESARYRQVVAQFHTVLDTVTEQ
jgi:hypothetical protein